MAYSTTSTKGFGHPRRGRPGQAPTVLLADDYQPLLWLLVRTLEEEFDIVGAVTDGKALVEAAQALRPDVIVTDWSMPVMNGLEATRQIRQTVPHAKVIFFTSHAEPECATAAMASGAAAYLVKGDIGDLASAVRAALQGNSAAA